MTSRVAFVFPGQGSQRVGMLDSLGSLPDADRLLDHAGELTGLSLRRIASDGPDDALADTRAAQPLLYLAGIAWARAVETTGVTPEMVAGHSLGELTALAYAGVFTVEAGLELVCARGRIMSETASQVPGTMAAVLGMDRDVVIDVLAAADGVWVANDNGPGQVVLSGTHAGIERATQALAEAGARKIVPLKVAGPFHCPLMAPARDRFAEIVATAAFADGTLPVLQNTDPRPATDAETIRMRLLSQITSPVRWTETMTTLVASGIDTLVECGPASVLAGLARRVEGLRALASDGDGIDRIREEVLA